MKHITQLGVLSPDQLMFLGILDIIVGYCAWPATVVVVALLAKRVLDSLEAPTTAPTPAPVLNHPTTMRPPQQ